MTLFEQRTAFVEKWFVGLHSKRPMTSKQMATDLDALLAAEREAGLKDIATLQAEVERLKGQLAEIKEDGRVESQRRQLAEDKLAEAERQRETE